MLIFIHLILNIFICSLQSITTNVYGGEGPSNNNLKQLESTYDKDEQPLTINRDKRYLDGGNGDPAGDGAAACSGPECSKGYCLSGHCVCRPCPRSSCTRCRPKYIWHPPRIRKTYWGRKRPRGKKRGYQYTANMESFIYEKYLSCMKDFISDNSGDLFT
uniref:Uncharacterized protein n=1 Tax=Meloidogyne javanica TaxID=6303 RepID=A0A915LPS5_MELJA